LPNDEKFIEIIERLTRMEENVSFIRKHVEVLNEEHGELVKRIAVLERQSTSLKAYWKVIVAIGTFVSVTVPLIIKLIGMI
jgi:prefoldin subunit 5